MCCFLLVLIHFISFTFMQRNIHIPASDGVEEEKIRGLIDRSQAEMVPVA